MIYVVYNNEVAYIIRLWQPRSQCLLDPCFSCVQARPEPGKGEGSLSYVYHIFMRSYVQTKVQAYL
jgi:hypothetical protein